MDDLSTRFKTFSTHPSCRIVVDSCSDMTLPMVERLGVDLIEFPFVMADGDHLDDQYDLHDARRVLRPHARRRARPHERHPHRPLRRDLRGVCARRDPDALPELHRRPVELGARRAPGRLAWSSTAHPDFELVVLDNCLPSLTVSLLAAEACRMRDEGASMREVAAWCEADKGLRPRLLHPRHARLARGGRPRPQGRRVADVDARHEGQPQLRPRRGAHAHRRVARAARRRSRTSSRSCARTTRATRGASIGIVDADCPDDADALEEHGPRGAGRQAAPASCGWRSTRPSARTWAPAWSPCAFWGVDRASVGGARQALRRRSPPRRPHMRRVGQTSTEPVRKGTPT